MTTNIAIALVSYLLGILTGYYLSGYVNKFLSLSRESYKNLVLLLVTLAWFASVLFEIINPTFKTNPLVHGLMGGIVGFFFKAQSK